MSQTNLRATALLLSLLMAGGSSVAQQQIWIPQNRPFMKLLQRMPGFFQLLEQDIERVIEEDASLGPLLTVAPDLAAKIKATAAELRVTASRNFSKATFDELDNLVQMFHIHEALDGFETIDRTIVEPGDHRKTFAKKAVGDGGAVADLLGDLWMLADDSGIVSSNLLAAAAVSLLTKLCDGFAEFIEQAAGMDASQKQIEQKLDQLAKHLGELINGMPIKIGPSEDAWMFEVEGPNIRDEVWEVKQRVEKFAALTGKTLTGTEFKIGSQEMTDPDSLPNIDASIQVFREEINSKLVNFAAAVGLCLEGKPIDLDPGSGVPPEPLEPIKWGLQELKDKLHDSPPGGVGVGVGVGRGVGLSLDVEHVEPRIQRRESGLVHVFPAKFICGKTVGGPEDEQRALPNGPIMEGPLRGPVEPADYATVVNIVNLGDQEVRFVKRAAVALSQREPRGTVGAQVEETLGPGEALGVDCTDIRLLLALDPPGAGNFLPMAFSPSKSSFRRSSNPKACG